jgi:hypothetical protein
MKLFLHTLSRIRIMHGDQEFVCTPDQFQALEPDYPGLPTLTHAPAVTRYQTAEWKYVEDSQGRKQADMFDALPYCDKIADYDVSPPAIWVHPTQGKTLLCAGDPEDVIPFTISLRTGPTLDDPPVPLTAMFPIMLRQKNGLAMDNILVSFVDGQASGNYTHNPALPLGEWYIDEVDFDRLMIEGVDHVVKLVAPVRFTAYRVL